MSGRTLHMRVGVYAVSIALLGSVIGIAGAVKESAPVRAEEAVAGPRAQIVEAEAG